MAERSGERSAGHGEGVAQWRHSLSVRLFWLTMLVILLVELVVFIPSAGAFRSAWLEERAQAARIASLAIEAAPMRDVSMDLSDALAETAEVLALAEIEDGMRFQILPPAEPIRPPVVMIDLRSETMMDSMWRAMGALFVGEGRTLMIVDVGARDGRVIELLVREAPLAADLRAYAWRILLISLLISLSAGALVFAGLFYLVVRPMRRVTRSVEQFRDDPGAWTKRLPETSRRDEIGRAQNALSDMERAVSESFRQRERLAQLGEAVARINHDLRGSLAAAQLVSEGLSRSEDERVQRAAPRLERALTRAINLATQTLQYGKTRDVEVHLQTCDLSAIVEEAAEEALAGQDGVAWTNRVPAGLVAEADPDHLHRIAANLIRNAAQAMPEGGAVEVRCEGAELVFADTGPGLPGEIASRLFTPFTSRGKRGGTGLGLAIARDLARAMGGELSLRATGAAGTSFTLRLPTDPRQETAQAAQ